MRNRRRLGFERLPAASVATTAIRYRPRRSARVPIRPLNRRTDAPAGEERVIVRPAFT